MSLAKEAPQRAPTIYAMPESAHIELVHLRNHLYLMAQLTAAGAAEHDTRLRPEALAWCFSRLRKDIDEIIAASSFCTELATAFDSASRPRKSRPAPKR